MLLVNYIGFLVAVLGIAQSSFLDRERRAAGCDFEGATIANGETKDGENFRKTCTNGYLQIDGCMFNGQFVGKNQEYVAPGSNQGYKCTESGNSVSRASFFTGCKQEGKVVADNEVVEAGRVRRRCRLAPNKSSFNWETLGCIIDGKFVKLGTELEVVGTNKVHRCSGNNTHTSSGTYEKPAGGSSPTRNNDQPSAGANNGAGAGAGCNFEGYTVAEGETRDGANFRKTCNNGVLSIDGCMHEGNFVAIGSQTQKPNSPHVFKCTSDGSSVKGATILTKCQHEGKLVGNKEVIQVGSSRMQCNIAPDGSKYSWVNVGGSPQQAPTSNNNNNNNNNNNYDKNGNSPQEKVGSSCTFANTNVPEGATKDIKNYRVSCKDGKLKIDGCVYENHFVQVNTVHQDPGSPYAFKCSYDGTFVSGKSYYTYCKFEDRLISHMGTVDGSNFRRRCKIADDKSTYSWEIIGCFLHNHFVNVNQNHQDEGSEVGFKCKSNGTHVAAVKHYTNCKYNGKLYDDNAVFETKNFRHQCDVADDGSTYTIKITHCLLKHEQFKNDVEIGLGQMANVALKDNTSTSFACRLNDKGQVSMSQVPEWKN